MTTTLVGTGVGVIAVAFFLAGGGRRGWWLLAVALLASGLGGGGLWLLEKGPQGAFAHIPLSPHRAAWTLDAVALLGLGGVVGLIVRGALNLARRR